MDNWEKIRLGEFLTLKRGFDLPSHLRNDSGIVPVISSAGILGYHTEPKISPPGVVTGRYGSVGAVFYVDKAFWPLNTTLYVEDFKGNDALFTYYLLQTLNFKKYSDKTSVPGVNRNDLHRIKLLRPPLPEQQKIAEILSTWDEVIEKTERLIAALQTRKKGLMQRLLNGQVRFPGFNREWKEAKLEDCCDILDNQRIPLNNDERVNRQGNIPYYGANGILDYIDDNIFDEPLILIAEDGGYFDEASFRPICQLIDGKSWVNNHAHVLRAKPGNVREWIYYWFVHRNIVPYINGGTRSKLNQKDLRTLPIKLPTYDEQLKVSSFLKECDQEIKLHNEILSIYNSQKKGLMQRLLTGQVRVRLD